MSDKIKYVYASIHTLIFLILAMLLARTFVRGRGAAVEAENRLLQFFGVLRAHFFSLSWLALQLLALVVAIHLHWPHQLLKVTTNLLAVSVVVALTWREAVATGGDTLRSVQLDSRSDTRAPLHSRSIQKRRRRSRRRGFVSMNALARARVSLPTNPSDAIRIRSEGLRVKRQCQGRGIPPGRCAPMILAA